MHNKSKFLSLLNLKSCLIILLGAAFLAFGLYQVHSLSGVTEGGVLGLNLLLEHWFHISPSVTNAVVTAGCYLLGWRLLGKQFIVNSAVAVTSFSVSYAIFEQFDHLWPQLYEMPLLAAVVGAIFVGVGSGLCVRQNAAMCGDDAIAMCANQVLGIPIQWAYFISDAVVLLLSLSYIPVKRIIYSFLTVILSGQIIGLFQRRAAVDTRQGLEPNSRLVD